MSKCTIFMLLFKAQNFSFLFSLNGIDFWHLSPSSCINFCPLWLLLLPLSWATSPILILSVSVGLSFSLSFGGRRLKALNKIVRGDRAGRYWPLLHLGLNLLYTVVTDIAQTMAGPRDSRSRYRDNLLRFPNIIDLMLFNF